jgi:hypothetical protein
VHRCVRCKQVNVFLCYIDEAEMVRNLQARGFAAVVCSTCSASTTREEEIVARIAHQCWVSFQIAAGQPYNVEPTEAQLKSQINGLRAFVQNPVMTPEQNHENWMQLRLSQGWTHGPVKDETAKTHPDLVPFSEMPKIEQLKDTMDLEARKFALTLLARLGIGG